MRIRVLAALSLAVLLSVPSQASDWWIESTEESPLRYKVVKREDHAGYRVNWIEKHLEVMAGATVDNRTAVNQAHAVAMATKTARHLAYEKLAETVRGLHITSDSRYDRELMLDANVRTDLEARIRGAQIMREETSEFPDGSVWGEVTLGLDMLGPGGGGGVVARGQDYHRRPPSPQYTLSSSGIAPGAADARHAGAPAATDDAREMPDFREKHSGLIIDARGLRASPVLVPRLVTESGQVVYDERIVDRKYMEKHALVDYAPDVDAARKLDRVGKNPLVIKALGVSGTYPGDIVVSDDAAALIHATIKNKKILKKCGVAIVL